MRLLPCSVIAALLLLGVGCASDPGPREQMNMTKECSQTRCGAMRAEVNGYCSACLSACSSAGYNCDSSTACDASCGDHDVSCSDAEQSECVKTKFTAALPDNANREVEAACNRARARVTSCGQEAVPPAVCTLMGKVERAEVSTTYDCMAKQPCDADMEICALPTTTLGDELCAGGNQQCTGLCNDETQAYLNDAGAWFRPGVQQAARGCLAQASCTDVRKCFNAWLTATVP